ncbi:proteasome subunit beta type-1 [Teleopsis dalmanni]|uniref:proteasome subunit beta type-1 n=1 Tax=Teleopsis dalmanni TaxID=139649 RepID=UPI0018CD1F2C|nr:proteasome subunit beta type-1 [Teleopsis dalmanni]
MFANMLNKSAAPMPYAEAPGIQRYDFSPYESNGGSIVAIGGDDFVVIGADTRLSTGYSIHTRDQNKIFKLTPNTVLGSTGCWCDSLALTSLLRARVQMYEHSHLKTISTDAIAQLLSVLMYSKRFFPYYVSNILAGLDNEGKGIVYSYDPIGHCERTKYRAGGSAGALLQPVLDNLIGYKNMNIDEIPPISLERAISVTTDVFISAAERDIYTGDAVLINIITKDGVEVKEIALRKD